MTNKEIEYKHELYQTLAMMSKGLASDKRLEILNLLTQSPKTVEGIAQSVGLSVANTSRHLQVLKNSGLVNFTKDKNYIIYQVSSPKVKKLIRFFFEVGAEELPNFDVIARKADSEEDVKTISLEEVIKIDKKTLLLLDVRPNDEFKYQHILGAVNIPLEELSERLCELSKDQDIVVYCRGRLCSSANMATQILNSYGFHARSLNASYLDWQEYHAKL